MDEWNDLALFVRIAEHGGLSAAGRALGAPKSSLSRRLQLLEERLGVRLVQRTSRKFIITDVGEAVLEHARAMRVQADAVETVARHRVAEPSGMIRMTCSIGMSKHLVAPLLPRFMVRHPKVDVFLHATNRLVDLVEERFDLALRGYGGPLPDTGLVQRLLSPTPWVLVAAPRYLDARGAPATPDELRAHSGLLLGGPSSRAVWRLHSREATEEIPFVPRLRTDDSVTLLGAAVAGLGIVALPEYSCRDERARGELRRVLPEWQVGDHRVTMLVPSRRGQLPAVRALADFLASEVPRLVGRGTPRAGASVEPSRRRARARARPDARGEGG
ncbi:MULTISPECIES: LysR substrate-binding domain-containing protein [Sorangium]|uniref:LysR family transcriptional regulator n=1 Tax=Sorangium cellulosum TaxID=56 RepID=A0A4V0NHZ5_SORCE|nr:MULTISPECIES: LysR substrate-binding domain-containing protein [Sorangium]AUX38392.1 LysR family transcriptional regulator [Sorangium cellulosum]WCQ97680.1 HTH-type transcriptional regulator DmlR [Sorangium sp. Soce836]